MVQFQEVSNGLVLLLRKLEDNATWLHSMVVRQHSPGGAAQVSSGMWPKSEWVWTVWWCQAGGHNWGWSVELEAIQNLKRKEDEKRF